MVGYTIIMIINNRPNRACKSHNINNQLMLFTNKCTQIDYNILHNNGKSCEIYLHGTIIEPSPTYSIDIKSNWNMYSLEVCRCISCEDSSMSTRICIERNIKNLSILKTHIISIDSCNIDDQTIQLSGSSWIVDNMNSENIHHSYKVSTQCPFDHYLPDSSHLNLSNPDSQCQFDRTGLLCGRYKEGFSTVFGISQCRKCSTLICCFFYYLHFLVLL